MTKQHPITPPQELVRKWAKSCSPYDVLADHIATQAAQWGDNQRLEACCEWLREATNHGFGYDMGRTLADKLGAAMRPKPPSLAEEALEQLNGIETVFKATYGGDLVDDYIRLALKRLQELENNG